MSFEHERYTLRAKKAVSDDGAVAYKVKRHWYQPWIQFKDYVAPKR